MERLNYIVEDSTIAELLGVENFTNKESAILELVKNAYDAHARKVTVTIKPLMIVIQDDGIGMDREIIKNNWMHVGKSNKGYKESQIGDERILAGSKGIGRFALARLGAYVVVKSRKRHSQPLRWETDWNESTLSDASEEDFYGTYIEISMLRDRWTETGIAKLVDYLSVTYKDDKMAIEIVSETNIYNVSHYYEKPQLGKNFVTDIKLIYKSESNTLECLVISDEFRQEAEKYCKDIDLRLYKKTVNCVEELYDDREIDFSKKELKEFLERVGDFNANLFFSLKSSTTKDYESFLYKYDKLNKRYDKGVVLYRNAFSLSSYDGKKDWLGFGKRSRKSPAAATHPSGAWRVRENQISGMVNIDKKNNANLKDLSNRQGLDENEFFVLFVKIIDVGVAIFERYRQDIIRNINKKNNISKAPKPAIIQDIIKTPSKVKDLSPEDVKSLAIELSTIEKESKTNREEKRTTEERYRYDVRILNVLATSGLKATSIAHELQNDRNSVSVNYNYIVKALKEYDFWEELNSLEYTEKSHKNVPQLLERNRSISEKILVFMDTMLDEVEKQKFATKDLSISDIMKVIKSNWVRDYASLNIDLKIDEDLRFETAEDIFPVIFDNLILNSIQQNEHQNKIDIKIFIDKKGDYLDVTYSDNGQGLPPKFIHDPMRILAVHETSRKKGHGLGMWIVNNTVQMTGGTIKNIDGIDGFKIYLELGDKL
ncbi:signal transduction histidine kinase [Lachnospiraceae bacterium PF1-21]|uniref:histidine kinase n=1 Tax=Ohessyouella blattaphilus TaxID=2949333 RepID=A0ABT1EJJ2_9FIRM|nr:ATP-binding protein [Ohessyouella blattaphilus]MCP1110875.1 ATP-binding protein [Ohessyouella blattaphilus]MCR8564269.1 ATP-binding protein [Ohessyouella blattaphilus]